MSIQSEIDRISGNVQDTISAIQQTGVTVPEGANSDNLPSLAAALANEKQDKLTGTSGQFVGFNSGGNATAVAAPTAASIGAVPTSRTVNGKTLNSNITLSAGDVGALPLSGGTLTGNLTGKYITGTWLQATAAADLGAAATKIAVFDGSGWLYYRTPAQIRSKPHIYRDTESASVSHRLYHCKASQYSGRHGGFDSGQLQPEQRGNLSGV